MSFADDNQKAWAEITELHRSRPEEFGTIETANGPGATLAQTTALRELLPILFERYGIKSVLDVGCGDWNWMSQVDLGDVAYLGWDVEESMIAANNITFSERPNVRFQVRSLLTVQEIPKVDLILARHVLIHFPNEEITRCLDLFRASGSKYLLTSHWPDGSNDDYEPEGFAWRGYMERAINLEKPPFFLPHWVEAIDEPAADAGVLRDAHELGLYDLQSDAVLLGARGEDTFLVAADEPVGTVVSGMIKPIQMCEHRATFRVHRADNTVDTICGACQQVIDSRGEAGGVFSFHDTIARWATDVTQGVTLGASDRPARLQGRPVTRRELLKGLKENHREVVEMARKDNSLASAWLLLGAQAAVIDGILDELLGGEDV